MPTELEGLKAKWLEEPYWVIEDTEGFEAHRDELRQFHRDTLKRREKDKQARLIKFINQYQPEKLNKLKEAREPELDSKSRGALNGVRLSGIESRSRIR